MTDDGADPNAATVALSGVPGSGAPSAAVTDNRLELPLDQLFAGRYLVERKLGRGGMGVVYLVHDRLVDEKVALKILDLASSLPDAVELFCREVRFTRRITHPNVVRIHDLVEDVGGRLFLTMEFVDGADLRHEIDERGGRLDAARVARVALEVAEALHAAHSLGIVHRDLKPENILVDCAGRLVLTDFGIAQLLGDAGESSSATLGTPAYMAPEQVAAEQVGPAADVYALGVVMFEALAGRPPFVGDNAVAVALARLSQAAPDVRTLAQVPEPLGGLIMRCLLRQPQLRPAAAEEVAAILEGYLDGLGPESGKLEPREPALVRAPARTLRTTRGSRSIAVPFAAGRRALCVLPFSYRGSTELDYLGDAVAGELTDVLSRTKGLRVLGSGVVARLGSSRDAQEIAQTLDVDYVVDGTVQTAGSKLRITVRLLDATGTQLTSERFDLGLADIFDVQDEAGRRIAEALRLEIVTRSSAIHVPEEVIQLYLRARTILRSQQFMQAYRAAELLERALEISPSFAPAVASLSLAMVYVWFFPKGAPARNWERDAEKAVANALSFAPDLAETQVAAARFASHRGKLREAVEAVRRAVELAPTSPEPQYLLGQLECETGRVDEGVARLALAFQLEPALTYPYEAARAAALRGDQVTFDRQLAKARAIESGLPVTHLALRQAGWTGNRERLEAVIVEARVLGAPFDRVVEIVAGCFLGRADPAQAVSVMSPVIGFVNARFGGLLRQVLVEVHAHRGDVEGALEWLTEAHDSVLYDRLWLERCPLLEPLRREPGFIAIASAVTARCEAVWAR